MATTKSVPPTTTTDATTAAAAPTKLLLPTNNGMSPLSGELGSGPVNLWSELAAVEFDDEIPSPLSVDDIPPVTIINGHPHEGISNSLLHNDEPQTMEELQRRRAQRLEQVIHPLPTLHMFSQLYSSPHVVVV
jgi:hypothetical protein